MGTKRAAFMYLIENAIVFIEEKLEKFTKSPVGSTDFVIEIGTPAFAEALSQ